MNPEIPKQMKAAAIDRYGGPEVLHTETLPVPRPRADQVLIRLDTAGVGVWDPYVREGEFELGQVKFPYVIGNDGAGSVVAVGDKVKRVQVGDRVYTYALEGGCYAEYAAIKEDEVAPIPEALRPDEAGALGADGITALRGLDDRLHLSAGQTILIFGASGGIGHLAVQLSKRIGARVFAVASGPDGVELVRRLGADEAVDGHRDDVAKSAKGFAPDGFDAALVLAGDKNMTRILRSLKKDGRVAFPRGVEPEPKPAEQIKLLPYDGTPSPEAFARLNRLIGEKPFHVELGKVYPLDQAAQAHREIQQHHLGKLALRIH